LVGLAAIDGNFTGIAVTVMLQFAVYPPSFVLTVIVALPAARAVTSPFVETVAIFVLLDDHVTLLFVAFEGETVAVNCTVAFTSAERLVELTVTPVTDTLAIIHVAVTVRLPAGMENVPPKGFVPVHAVLVKPLNV
jgi:hypothetical protein